MKVKELPKDIPLTGTKVRIPDEYKHDAFLVGLQTMEVYLYSSWACGMWVKSDFTSDRIYPLHISPDFILEWDVIEDDK